MVAEDRRADSLLRLYVGNSGALFGCKAQPNSDPLDGLTFLIAPMTSSGGARTTLPGGRDRLLANRHDGLRQRRGGVEALEALRPPTTKLICGMRERMAEIVEKAGFEEVRHQHDVSGEGRSTVLDREHERRQTLQVGRRLRFARICFSSERTVRRDAE